MNGVSTMAHAPSTINSASGIKADMRICPFKKNLNFSWIAHSFSFSPSVFQFDFPKNL